MPVSQLSVQPVPNVWQLRRKKVPDEFTLPADYVPTDYTALPPEEPKKGMSPLAKLLLFLVLLAVVGGIAYYVLVLSGKEEVTEQPTQIPETQLNVERADIILSGGRLSTRIDATTDAPDGTSVEAVLLENGEPFQFWNQAETIQKVANGRVQFTIAEADEHPAGTEGADYAVQLTAALDDGTAKVVTAPLTINPTAVSQFTTPRSVAGASTPTTQPTTAPTEPTAPSEPTTLPEPTAPPGPLADIVVSRDGTLYLSPYGPTGNRGAVATGQQVTLVSRLSTGGATWYLVAVQGTALSGWLNSNAIDLPAVDVARVPEVSDSGDLAVVFNGGNVRNQPGGSVVGGVDAGINVRVTGRTADNNWFEIAAPDGTSGWVAASLLTINPNTLSSVPVK